MKVKKFCYNIVKHVSTNMAAIRIHFTTCSYLIINFSISFSKNPQLKQTRKMFIFYKTKRQIINQNETENIL